MTWSWYEGYDPETGAGVTYNLRLGTTPGGGEIVTPMAADGKRLLPAPGKVGQNRTLKLIHPEAF